MKIFKNKKLVILVELVLIATLFFVVYKISQNRIKKSASNLTTTENNFTEVAKPLVTENTENTTKTEQVLPEKVIIPVPFKPQAPFADWSEPYQNACEEASIIMVLHYLNQTPLSADEMKSEIDAAVDWQIKNWGGHDDLDATKTLKLATDYFGLTGKILKNYSVESIKKELAAGNPVIAPTAGISLGNPNFSGIGPEYHMLVIIGYNSLNQTFITNDPGTRNGEKYVYNYQTLLDAISGPKENMVKEILIISKK